MPTLHEILLRREHSKPSVLKALPTGAFNLDVLVRASGFRTHVTVSFEAAPPLSLRTSLDLDRLHDDALALQDHAARGPLPGPLSAAKLPPGPAV